jgi:carbamate kinase
MTEFSRINSKYTVAPMSLCSAMSQGYVGYDLQNAIRTELLNRGIYKPVCTIITQVKVNPFDKAFHTPSKVIGRTMTEAEAELEEKKGNYVIKTENGYRRIIASPKPMDIYEADSIKALIDAGQIVIAGGGGGIPVFEQETTLKGASAIIEKDLTAAKLAALIDADYLLYLTGVDKVQIGFGTPEATEVDSLTIDEANSYIDQDVFAEGQMLPKIEGSVDFVSARAGRKAIITSLTKALAALAGKTGTTIE